jgi:hypothetical protein
MWDQNTQNLRLFERLNGKNNSKKQVRKSKKLPLNCLNSMRKERYMRASVSSHFTKKRQNFKKVLIFPILETKSMPFTIFFEIWNELAVWTAFCVEMWDSEKQRLHSMVYLKHFSMENKQP